MVSLSCVSRSVSKTGTRLPLSPYRNPISARRDSLGAFHNGFIRPLSSFANSLSKRYRPDLKAMRPDASLLFPDLFTQGRLHCTQRSRHTPHRTALQVQAGTVQKSLTTKGVRLCTISGLHRNRVRILHAIGGRPVSAGEKRLPPASTPDWA